MSTWTKWNTEFDERLPIYQQIIDRFCRSVVRGEIEQGERIPSIRDMALALKVNPNTVQRVYQELERRGMIYSRRGTGYFVTEEEDMIIGIQQEMAQDSTRRFLEEMRGLGFSDQQILAGITSNMKGENENGIIDANKKD